MADSSQGALGATRGNASSLVVVEADDLGLLPQQGALSRTDMARLTGYSRAKITPIVSRLLESGILQEIGAGASQGGRRPRLLHFNSRQGCVLGVDIGATSLDVVLADLTGQIIERAGPGPILDQMRACAERLLARRGIGAEQVYALGIGVPGLVQFATGLLIAPPLMPGWERYPIAERMRRSFPHAQVAVDNDVNRSAGDIGHICADPSGPICHCGNIGCLEAVAAGPPIAAQATGATGAPWPARWCSPCSPACSCPSRPARSSTASRCSCCSSPMAGSAG